MSCNRSRALAVAVFMLVLAACKTTPEPAEPMAEPVMEAPPPPPPAAAMPAPPPPTFRVRSGSPAVLEKFPRGSEVTRTTRICLKEGEQITISGSNGQQVSYRGPGCMQRTAPPTGDNQGGFIFGFNGWGVPTRVAAP